MSLHSVPLFSFDFFPCRPIEIEVSSAPLTSDAGLLPIRQLDDYIKLTEQFAAALYDRRDPNLTQQSLLRRLAKIDCPFRPVCCYSSTHGEPTHSGRRSEVLHSQTAP